MQNDDDIKVADYGQIQESLKHYSTISIVSVEKDPPEQYVIEYRLRGYAYGADESVGVADKHQVQIDLPFGYPHFPPTVKPLTRIFHPDMAETAVRVADYWEKNRSLVDLVIHIGDMIRGKVYSTGNSFNQDAVEWYGEHQAQLPLDRLRYVDDSRKDKAQPPEKSRTLPYKLILTVLLAVLAAGGGGMLYRDYHILEGARRSADHAEELIEKREFQQAKTGAETALDALQHVLFLDTSKLALLEHIGQLLQSRRLTEGLQGRVEYQGRFVETGVADVLDNIDQLTLTAGQLKDVGEIEEAIATYEEALGLAREIGMTDIVVQVSGTSAVIRFDHYLLKANEAYGEERWALAAELYGKAVSVLRDEDESVGRENLVKLEKIDKLRLLSTLNVSKEEALVAEKGDDLERAVEYHQVVINSIDNSEYSFDPLLRSVLEKSKKEVDRLVEKGHVAEGSAWLLKNYKELFVKHYPGVRESSLQSPRTRFVGTSGRNLVFILSCVELIQMRSNKFRLYYQYDPVDQHWSRYYGKK